MTDDRITTIREALGNSDARFALDSLTADLRWANDEIERLKHARDRLAEQGRVERIRQAERERDKAIDRLTALLAKVSDLIEASERVVEAVIPGEGTSRLAEALVALAATQEPPADEHPAVATARRWYETVQDEARQQEPPAEDDQPLPRVNPDPAPPDDLQRLQRLSEQTPHRTPPMTDPRITTIREDVKLMASRLDRQEDMGHGGYGGCPHDLWVFIEAADMLRSLAADLATAEAEIERLRDRMSMAAEILTRPEARDE